MGILCHVFFVTYARFITTLALFIRRLYGKGRSNDIRARIFEGDL